MLNCLIADQLLFFFADGRNITAAFQRKQNGKKDYA